MKTRKEEIAERQAKLDGIVAQGIQDVLNEMRERLEITEDKIEQLEIKAAMEPRNTGRY